MRSFGIRSQLDPVVSLALGPAEISVEEMVGAYSTFANKGLRVTPMYVTRIEDNNGNVLATFLPEVNEVVSEETSYKMVNMLRGVIDEPAVKAKNDMGGTGGRVRWMYGIKGEVGGKTGTTQNSSDCWFMGFTPELVSGVWIGGEERSIHFDGRAGQGVGWRCLCGVSICRKCWPTRIWAIQPLLLSVCQKNTREIIFVTSRKRL